MLTTADLKPLQRKALVAALHSPTHTLTRSRTGYVAQGTNEPHPPAFTKRLVNALDRDGLVDFDPPEFPSNVTLNRDGVRLAEQLVGASKAGGA